MWPGCCRSISSPGSWDLDTYWGLLLPHVAVHICFFSWIMKGFFDGIDPSMEYAAMIDGCSRWGAFFRVALPAAVPGLSALAILCWLFTWNEFLFALILTAHETPILTVVMAQFVHELGMEWHLMSATAVIALVPALIITAVRTEIRPPRAEDLKPAAMMLYRRGLLTASCRYPEVFAPLGLEGRGLRPFILRGPRKSAARLKMMGPGLVSWPTWS